MKEELQDKLFEEFPLTFSNMVWLECDDGWYDLIRETAQKLEPLIKNSEFEDDEKPKTVQLKEKFGGCRWYLSSGSKEMYDITSEAENKSMTICEACSNPSKIRSKGYWLVNMCDDCWEIEKKV